MQECKTSSKVFIAILDVGKDIFVFTISVLKRLMSNDTTSETTMMNQDQWFFIE